MIQTKNRGKYRILPGNPEKMGASATKDGYNFAVEVSDGKKAELLLYRKGHQKPFLTVPLPEEEREKFAVIKEKGFVDSFRMLYPDTVTYSWWSYRFQARQRNAGWRLDYFMVSESLKDAVADAKIHTEILGSDHCPVELDLEV